LTFLKFVELGLVFYSLEHFTAAHPSPPNYTSEKEAWPCGVDVQMDLKG
jgi:hypothetical protein